MPKIILSNHYTDGPWSVINALVPKGFELTNLSLASQEELLRYVVDADYILASGRVRIDARVIDAAPRLKMIQRTGVGLDSIDLELLKERNIPLYINQGINADSVAEHTIMLILAVLRRLPVLDHQVRQGIWVKQENGILNRELKGRTVGVIGMGHIGKRVVSLLAAFGCKIIYSDVCRTSEEFEKQNGLTYVPVNTLLENSDVVTLHCPLTEHTRGMLGKEAFLLMRRGSVVVNTARGGLIDEQALAEAIISGTVGGAGIDVYSHEPVRADSPLLALDRIVFTPHVGGVTYDSFSSMMAEAMYNIECFEKGLFAQIESKKFCL